MHHKQIKHTIEIFEIMYKQLPPLVPEEIKKEMEHALDHLKNDFEVGIEGVENMVIALGKKVWPYWKALVNFITWIKENWARSFCWVNYQLN